MFGEFIKERRIAKGISLREFCKRIEIDASNWSKVERSLLAPPQDEEKLRKIAQLLDVKIGSPLWKEMKDKADETRNKKTPCFFYWSGRGVMFFNVPLNIFRMT